MNKLVLILLATATLGCGELPKDNRVFINTGNKTLEFLFEHEGCKVYHFTDRGHDVYWSDCTGKITHEETHRSGKVNHTYFFETLINNHVTKD
jgi:hypothetical protein